MQINAITLPRYRAPFGVACNPYFDNKIKDLPYFQLLNYIAQMTELSAGMKIFHAACLYRARPGIKNRLTWLDPSKLAELMGCSIQMIYRYTRELKLSGLIVPGRFDSWLLVNPEGDPFNVITKKEDMALYKTLRRSRIPLTLVQSAVSSQATVVYGRLCGLAGKNGFWHGPNQGRLTAKGNTTMGLADHCGCKIRSLRRAIHELESEKMIRVTRYGNGGIRPIDEEGENLHGGGHNVYHFLGHPLFRQGIRQKSTFTKT